MLFVWASGHVGAPLPCAMVKLTDIPEMNYLAKNGEGEVSEIVLKGYRLPVAPTHTRRERERERKREDPMVTKQKYAFLENIFLQSLRQHSKESIMFS